MLKRILALVIVLITVSLVMATASAKRLSIGDPAPKLTVRKFIKGAPVTKFEQGKLYVVEF